MATRIRSEEQKQKDRIWHEKWRKSEKGKEWYRQWSEKNREKINDWAKDFQRRHPEVSRIRKRNERQKIRLEILVAYGGFSCVCDHKGTPCGPKPHEHLALDHINGDNKNDRKHKKGWKLYAELRREGYPPGFRVLCHCCNQSLGSYGYCPLSDTEMQECRSGIKKNAKSDCS